MIFIFEISTMLLKQIRTFAGKFIASIGKCTKIYKVPIIIHIFFNERPKITAKKIFDEIEPEIAELVAWATDVKVRDEATIWLILILLVLGSCGVKSWTIE